MNVGRNDPCPCGSGIKFKKCCLRKHEEFSRERIPDEVYQHVMNWQKEQQERIVRFGHVREPISIAHQGLRLVASGETVHHSPHWQFPTDFLLDFVQQVFGKEWGEAEMAKPFEKRHPIVQFKQKAIEYMKSEERNGPNEQGFYETIPNGYMAAYMAFAYDLFVVKDNGHLDEELIQRLKNKELFQGARHELFAEATCLRANYKIEHENEKDGLKKHVEFTAIHRETGEKISVEAKSKHRPGILGRPGTRETDEEINLRYGGLVNDAIVKNPPYPLVIFLDTNLPPSVAEEIYPKKSESEFEPHRVFKILFDRLRKEHGDKDPFNLIVFTNHPHHYGREDEVDPRKHTLSVMPRTPINYPAAELRGI